MNIDGKENVKERIKVFEKDKFITYLYIFENGNKYKETISKWKRQDHRSYIKLTPEDCFERQIERRMCK